MKSNLYLPQRYQYIKPCGQGGFGSVYLCHDNHLDRSIAIKTIRSNNKDEHRRLEDEINALIQIQSNHVVQVYDIVHDIQGKDTFGIVMEYIQGSELTSPCPCPIEDLLKILWQVALGISDIHKTQGIDKTGIIHRDIKLNNMMMDHEGIIKIFDFGLARNEGSNAQTNGILGTNGYIAPELCTINASFTQAVDVYAFGILALYLIQGDIPPELYNLPPSYPVNNPFDYATLQEFPELYNVLYQCLSDIPQNRPSIDQVVSILESYLLRDKHQAILIHNNTPYHLNSKNRSINLDFGKLGCCSIIYDGFNFIMQNITGDIYVNNSHINTSMALKGSYVITLGDRSNPNRQHLPFDTSNPEVVL